jgi:hypothetical protein
MKVARRDFEELAKYRPWMKGPWKVSPQYELQDIYYVTPLRLDDQLKPRTIQEMQATARLIESIPILVENLCRLLEITPVTAFQEDEQREIMGQIMVILSANGATRAPAGLR